MARVLRTYPELPFVVVVFLIYLVFQVHAAVFHGYWGQDLAVHKGNIIRAAKDPWDYITTYREGRTNPPLYHLLGGLVRRVVGLPNYLLGIGFMNLTLGLAGMIALYALTSKLILSPILRLAAMVFLLFVPFAMIHAEVIASDALSTPLFLVFVRTIVCLPDRNSRRSFGLSVASSSLILLAGVVTKFTFVSTIACSALWLAMLWWTRLLSVRRMAAAFVLVTVLPALLAVAQTRQYKSQQSQTFGLEPRASLSTVRTAEMNPRSIFFLRAADEDILQAPSYDWKIGDSLQLLKSNEHSLAALLQLGIFTDILNVYQYDPYDSYFGLRTVRNHRRMQVAVRTGIVFSLLALAGVIVVFARSCVEVLLHRKAGSVPVLTLLLFCLAWFFNIVALLPFVPAAYISGYWMPRLLAPALIGLFMAGFVFLDRMKWISRRAEVVVLVFVVAQSLLHASFLWPAPSADEVYEPNEDVVHATQPVFMRIVDWEEEEGTYWLGKTMGIVVNRLAGTGLETWRLRFVAEPGPDNHTLHRRVRISCRYCESKTVDFSAAVHIEVEVPIATGRNDILIEAVEPEQSVDLAGYPFVRLVLVSRIEFARADGVKAVPFGQKTNRGSLVSVSPHRSTAPKQTYTVIASDESGYKDIDYVYFLIDDGPTIHQFTCHGYYHRPTGAVLLYRDTTTMDAVQGFLGTGPPLGNGRCTIDPAASSANGSGDVLTMHFSLSRDPSYNKRNVYFLVKDHGGGATGWVDTGTVWDASAMPPPAPRSAK